MRPFNFWQIDKNLSCSSIPYGTGYKWLKDKGITDVICFRTKRDKKGLTEEKAILKKCGIKLHFIHSNTANPTENNVFRFLRLAKKLIQNGGKIHIHCVQGANRTGMYTFIYQMMHNLGDPYEKLQEWHMRGFNEIKYPNLMEWACNFVLKHKKF